MIPTSDVASSARAAAVGTGPDAPIQMLRRYAAPRPAGTEGKAPASLRATPEKCELCGIELDRTHRHLLELAKRRVVCACEPCALRFQDVVGGRFKLIPRDPLELPAFKLDDNVWEGFALPINLVFFFFSTAAQKMVALYPSPAGATESLLPLESWEQLVACNPPLARMQPDVEALLVNRVGDSRWHFIAPIDRCYALVGLIRRHWRGLSGGDAVWEKIAAFFDQLRTDSRPLPEEVPHE